MRSARATACWWPRPPAPGKTVVGEFAVHLALAAGPQVLLHHADQGAVQPEVRRPGAPLRRRTRRPAHRRQQHQRRRAGGGDDHRGAAQHALRRVADAVRPRLRRAGRGALPGRPVPRRGVGGGDHPPARVGPGRGAVGDGQQRRGVRRLAGSGPRRAPTVIVDEHRPVPLWQHMLAGHRLYDLFTDDRRTPRVNPELLRRGPAGHLRSSARPAAATRPRRTPAAPVPARRTGPT